MARKPVKRKKRTVGKSTRGPDLTIQIIKIVGGLALLIVLVVLVGLLAHIFIKRTPDGVTPANIPPVPPPKQQAVPTYEVFPKKALPTKPLTKLHTLPGDQPPLVAIIVDDIGHDRQTAALFIDIDAPLTISLLPFGRFTRQIAADARAKGHEIMLHLPMEPNEFPDVDPGQGALLLNMSPDELITQLKTDLDLIPGIKGVNNHMGSAISVSAQHMRQIFSVLKKRKLYYIDSRTTAETVARSSAQLLQIPFAERDIFIDHFEDDQFIRDQLKRLIKRAQRQGYAVGIAHPHTVTYSVLTAFLPKLKQQIELVPASMVVEAAMLAESGKIRTAAQTDLQ
jgi:polysaccharide deacetylase 2 family uncharacterized protein YibQ